MRNLTIERTAIFILFALLFAIAIRVPTDTDTWWHIRSGEYTLTQGMIHGDPFSHTFEGESWTNHSWGSQIILRAVWEIAGNTGLALYAAILAVGGMALLYKISAGNVYLRAFILILGASTAAVFWSARPQMLSFFFSTAILYIVYSYKRGGKDWLWFIVPLMCLWGNIHAGWSIGYLFLIAVIVGEALNNLLGIDEHIIGWKAWRKLLIATAISIPCLALSPYGIDNLLVPFKTINIDSLRAFIQEWQSPNFQGRETWPFIAMIMLLFMSLWLGRLKFDWSSFFLLIGTLFLALLYGRNIAVFAVAATPILTYHLDNALTERGYILRTRQSISPMMARLNLLMIVIVVLAVLGYGFSLLLPKNVEKVQSEYLPVDIARYMTDNDLPQPMFNSYNWGGYLMFAAPDYPVFVDGRTDLYGEFVDVYRKIALAIGNWQAILDEYGINMIVIERNSPLDIALRDSSIWQLDYEDELAVIWLRSKNNE
jgi:MFS family permease